MRTKDCQHKVTKDLKIIKLETKILIRKKNGLVENNSKTNKVSFEIKSRVAIQFLTTYLIIKNE